MFVGFEYSYIFQCLALFSPVYGEHLVAPDFAKITLRVNRNDTFFRKVFYEFEGKIVGKQAAEMVDAGVDIAQSVDSERIGFGQYPLGAVVLIFAVGVFKIN